MSDLLFERLRIAIREANPGMGDFSARTTANAILSIVKAAIASERDSVVFEAARIARGNTSAPRIWRDGRWISLAAEEIANIKTRLDNTADYAVVLKKTPPFSGALREAWRKGKVTSDDVSINRAAAFEDEDCIVSLVHGHRRQKRGVYDLLFRALRACGLDSRAPKGSA